VHAEAFDPLAWLDPLGPSSVEAVGDGVNHKRRSGTDLRDAASAKRERSVGPLDEKIQRLRERVGQLERDNTFYKTLLKENDPSGSCRDLIGKMERMAYQGKKARESRLRRSFIKLWNTRELFGDVKESEMTFKAWQVARALIAFRTTQVFFWFSSSPSPLVADKIRRELDLEMSQMQFLQANRDALTDMNVKCASLCEHISNSRVHYTKARNLFATFMEKVKNVCKPSQLAKLVVWVQVDDTANKILGKLWNSTVERLGSALQIERWNEMYSAEGQLMLPPPSGANVIIEQGRYHGISVIRSLLLNPGQPDQHISQSFLDNVQLLDSNAGHHINSVSAVIGYFVNVGPCTACTEISPVHFSEDSGSVQWRLSMVNGSEVNIALDVKFLERSPQISSIRVQWFSVQTTSIPSESPLQEESYPYSQNDNKDAWRMDIPVHVGRLLDTNDRNEAMDIMKWTFSEAIVLFDDSVGGEYRGIDACLQYVYKLRRVFTKFYFQVNNPSLVGDKQVDWKFQVKATYSGGLTEESRECTFTGHGSACHLPYDQGGKVTQLTLSWDTRGLSNLFTRHPLESM